MDNTTTLTTMHEVRDEAKVSTLMTSIERDGWVGAALVVWDDSYLITGTHRYAAACRLGIENEIPTIEIADVFAEAGLDFEALHFEHGSPAFGDTDLVELMGALPTDIREQYGIDLH